MWPGSDNLERGGEGACSRIIESAKNEDLSLLRRLSETEAGVGYADLADAMTSQAAKNAGVIFAHIQNATATQFVSPNSGKSANCDFRSLSLPAGGTTEGAVGLDPEENWATDNKEGNHGNATDLGGKYPICGLTWDLVYTGLDNGGVPNAISRLSADQRRTMYSFFTFVLFSAAEDALAGIGYAALPPVWIGTIREGFQANF
jgi:hypothetical protein